MRKSKHWCWLGMWSKVRWPRGLWCVECYSYVQEQSNIETLIHRPNCYDQKMKSKPLQKWIHSNIHLWAKPIVSSTRKEKPAKAVKTLGGQNLLMKEENTEAFQPNMRPNRMVSAVHDANGFHQRKVMYTLQYS